MNNIEESFSRATESLKSFQIETNQVIGRRRKSISTNLENLTFYHWSNTQYENIKSLCEERQVKLFFNYEQFCNHVKVNLEEQLRDILNVYMNSSFHVEASPVVDRKDLDKDYTLDNIHIITWEDKRKKWNVFFSKQKENTQLDIKKKSVKQIDPITNEVIKTYPSISDAKKFFGAIGHDSRIAECCEGKREQVYSFKWQYVENKITEESLW